MKKNNKQVAQEIKITNWPKKKGITSIVLSVISVLIAIYAAWFSQDSFNSLLPIEQSNLVVNEEDIKITHNPNENNYVIESTISNIGKATAKNISFSLYQLYFDNTIFLDKQIVPIWDDTIMNDLHPGSKLNFGTTRIGYMVNNGREERNLRDEEKQVALVYHISYQDYITEDIVNKWFYYQFYFDQNPRTFHPFSLINNDYKKISSKIKAIESNK